MTELTTVTESALAAAGAESEAIRAAARERAKRIVAGARADGDALIARRLAAAQRVADLEQDERLSQARAEARANVLRARRSAFLHASEAAHAAVRGLIADPKYPEMLGRCEADARRRLGAAGPVVLTDAEHGGLIARAGTLEIDYSLDAQTERCLHAIAADLEHLWR